MRVPSPITPRQPRASGEIPFIRNTSTAGAASTAALGNQLSQFGNTLGSVGGLLTQQASQARRMGVMQDFSAFQTSVDERMAELKRNADPAQGNFADQATAMYSNWETEWLTQVPDEFHDEFATRAADVKAAVARDALAFQYERTDEYFRQGVNDQYNLSLLSLDQDGSLANLDAQRQRIDEFIDATGLTEAEKLALRRKAYRGIEGVSYKSEVRRGNLDLGALGVGSAPGGAVDLILEFDGSAMDNGLDYETNRELIGVRVAEAEAAALESVGEERWAMIPSHARGALISLVDDLGGMPASVQAAIDTGDLENVAQAVADLEGDRRKIEAETILGLRRMPEGMLDADPRFANIPYEDRLALRADAEREAAAIQTAEQKAAIAAQKAATNELFTNLYDGVSGQYEIDQAREQGWLTDFDDIKKAQGILEDKTNDLRMTQSIQALLAAGMTGNPGDDDFRKAYNAYIGPNGQDAMRRQDAAYVQNVLIPSARTLGDLPTETVGLLSGMMRAQDPKQALFALDTLSQLEQASPEAYNARVTEAVAADVEYWRGIKDYYPQDEVLAAVRGGTTQEERTRVTMLREEASALIKDDEVNVNLVSTLGDMPNWQLGDPVMVAGTTLALNADFQQLFVREYARDGNKDAAQGRAIKALGRIWNTTNVGGQQLLMKYPPELVGYEKWNGTYDWITEQGRADLGLTEGETFQLVSDEQTRSEFQEWQGGAATRPSYIAIYKDVNGNLRMPTEKFRGAGGEMLDTGKPMRLFFEITPVMELEKQAQFSVRTSNQENERFMVTYNMALTHSLATGIPIPDELQEEYARRTAEEVQ